MIYIRNKLLRIVAGCLLLGGMASIFAYSIMIISSGDIVGKVQPVEVASDQNRIRSYDSMFRKAEFRKIYFPEMLLAPEMGKLKLELIIMGTGGSSRRYKLLTPIFSLA